jgi:hypothetical protein
MRHMRETKSRNLEAFIPPLDTSSLRKKAGKKKIVPSSLAKKPGDFSFQLLLQISRSSFFSSAACRARVNCSKYSVCSSLTSRSARVSEDENVEKVKGVLKAGNSSHQRCTSRMVSGVGVRLTQHRGHRFHGCQRVQLSRLALLKPSCNFIPRVLYLTVRRLFVNCWLLGRSVGKCQQTKIHL